MNQKRKSREGGRREALRPAEPAGWQGDDEKHAAPDRAGQKLGDNPPSE